MSTTLIIGGFLGLLFILVGIAVTLQSAEKARKEKRRAETQLNNRARNLDNLLHSFPEGFLSSDLQKLILKALVQVFTQLLETAPTKTSYAKQKANYQQRSQELTSKASSKGGLRLSDPEQIREVQKHLSELRKVVTQLAQNKNLAENQAKSYLQQINKLTTQTTIDSVNQQLAEANKEGKHKLAVHLIDKLLEKLKPNAAAYGELITEYEAQRQELQQLIVDAQTEAASEEWKDVGKVDETWKKKAIYD